jgi:hypothetical protein
MPRFDAELIFVIPRAAASLVPISIREFCGARDPLFSKIKREKQIPQSTFDRSLATLKRGGLRDDKT